jgi:hypothetical protein
MLNVHASNACDAPNYEPQWASLIAEASMQSSRATKAVTPQATLIAQGEDFERLRELLPVVEVCQNSRRQIERRITTSHSGAERDPSSDSSGDGASRPGDSNGGDPSRRADSNGGGPSKLDDANNDSHASGDASRRVQLSSARFLLPIARPSEQPGSMVLPRARIRPQRVPKQS